MKLTDGTLTLRALEPEDLDILYRWENDTRLWKDGAAIAPFSRKVLSDYIMNYDPDIFVAKQLRLMITLSDTGEAVGALDLYDFDARNCRCGVGIVIDEDFRGRGYAPEALNIAAEYCREHVGMHQLYAIVAVGNAASRRAFEKALFKTSGRLRSWIRSGTSYADAYVVQRLLTPVK